MYVYAAVRTVAASCPRNFPNKFWYTMVSFPALRLVIIDNHLIFVACDNDRCPNCPLNPCRTTSFLHNQTSSPTVSSSGNSFPGVKSFIQVQEQFWIRFPVIQKFPSLPSSLPRNGHCSCQEKFKAVIADRNLILPLICFGEIKGDCWKTDPNERRSENLRRRF